MPRLFVLLILLLPALARADTLAGLLSPPVSKQDHQAVTTLLHLTPAQKQSADQLFDGYLTAFTKEAAKYNASYRTYEAAAHEKPKDHKAEFEVFVAAFRAYTLKKIFAQHDLLTDYRALLTEQQLTDDWPAVDRLMHRKLLRHLATRTVSQWTRVDLLSVIDEAELAPASRALIAAHLTEYELALDKVLTGYHRLFWSKTDTWLDPNDDDLEKAAVDFGDPAAALNRKYSRWITELLPPDDSTTLLKLINDRAYDWLSNLSFRKTRMEATLSRAEHLEDLTPDIREQIAAIRRTWTNDLAEANRYVIAETDQADAELSTMTLEAFNASMNSETGPFNRVQTSTVARGEEIESKLNNTLRPLLTEDQRAKVWPPPPPEPK